MHLLRDDLILRSSHRVSKGDPNWTTLFDLTEELAVEYWFLYEAPKSWCGSCVKRRGLKVSCTDHAIETGPQGDISEGHCSSTPPTYFSRLNPLIDLVYTPSVMSSSFNSVKT